MTHNVWESRMTTMKLSATLAALVAAAGCEKVEDEPSCNDGDVSVHIDQMPDSTWVTGDLTLQGTASAESSIARLTVLDVPATAVDGPASNFSRWSVTLPIAALRQASTEQTADGGGSDTDPQATSGGAVTSAESVWSLALRSVGFAMVHRSGVCSSTLERPITLKIAPTTGVPVTGLSVDADIPPDLQADPASDVAVIPSDPSRPTRVKVTAAAGIGATLAVASSGGTVTGVTVDGTVVLVRSVDAGASASFYYTPPTSGIGRDVLTVTAADGTSESVSIAYAQRPSFDVASVSLAPGGAALATLQVGTALRSCVLTMAGKDLTFLDLTTDLSGCKTVGALTVCVSTMQVESGVSTPLPVSLTSAAPSDTDASAGDGPVVGSLTCLDALGQAAQLTYVVAEPE